MLQRIRVENRDRIGPAIGHPDMLPRRRHRDSLRAVAGRYVRFTNALTQVEDRDRAGTDVRGIRTTPVRVQCNHVRDLLVRTDRLRNLFASDVNDDQRLVGLDRDSGTFVIQPFDTMRPAVVSQIDGLDHARGGNVDQRQAVAAILTRSIVRDERVAAVGRYSDLVGPIAGRQSCDDGAAVEIDQRYRGLCLVRDGKRRAVGNGDEQQRCSKHGTSGPDAVPIAG